LHPSENVVVVCNDSAYFLRHRRHVVDALVEGGAGVHVITGGPPIPPEELGDWTYENIPIERFSFHPFADLRLAWRTISAIRKARAAAIHLITLKPAVVSGLAVLAQKPVSGRPARVLITIPGLGRLMSPGTSHRGFAARATRVMVRSVLRLLSARRSVVFTFETNSDRDFWLASGLVKPENSTVISGAGVDGRQFYPARSREPGPLRILFASRLLRAKGLDAFIDAARLTPQTDAEFIVAGMAEAGDRDSYLPLELSREPALHFLGEVRDMPGLLRAVDVVCLPTRYGEGIPRILIEAAAAGLPVIATDIEGCRAIVRDGESGVLVPPGDAGAMSRAIAAAVKAYADPELRLQHGTRAREIFEAGAFSEEQVVDRFIELLRGAPA